MCIVQYWSIFILLGSTLRRESFEKRWPPATCLSAVQKPFLLAEEPAGPLHRLVEDVTRNIQFGPQPETSIAASGIRP